MCIIFFKNYVTKNRGYICSNNKIKSYIVKGIYGILSQEGKEEKLNEWSEFVTKHLITLIML